MDTINLLRDYPIELNKNNFGIKHKEVEDELFSSVWIQRADPQYNAEAVQILSELWKCPINYLIGRLRCEAAHKLILIENNMAEGLYYYKLAASENQSAEALFSLANLKLNIGQSLPAAEEALEHLKLAVDQPAKIIFSQGEAEGEEEFKFTNKFIVESQLMYANLRFEGMGGKKDLEEAKKYYDLAWENSLVKGSPFAKYAIILCRGDGGDIIPKDEEKGLKILKDIIEEGGDNVQPGIIYTYGMFFFEKDPTVAINYIRHAAKLGYPVAREKLSTFEKRLPQLTNTSTNTSTTTSNKKKNSKPKQVKKNNLC